ncbi:MAG: S49 family peptidase [Candidatus Cloacimonetes bacterium]|nr:S49 family peptidase [Candidatus Cloacimonadota bacterium]
MKKILIILFLFSFLLMGCGSKLIDSSTTNSNNGFSIFVSESEKSEIIVVKLRGSVNLEWADQIEEAYKKENCIWVIAWIESRGGTFIETKLTAHKIRALTRKYKKELIVYSERGLYSGAYWIACEANAIVIAPSGNTGSIGVYSVRVDVTAADSVNGVKYHLIKSGKCKAMWFPHSKLTDEEKKVLQKQINKLYYEFLWHIYNCRGNQIYQACYALVGANVNDTTVANYLEKVCDGRSYDAKDAFTFGLIDKVMYFDEMIKDLYKNVPNTDIVTEDGEKIEDFYPEDN